MNYAGDGDLKSEILSKSFMLINFLQLKHNWWMNQAVNDNFYCNDTADVQGFALLLFIANSISWH